jgi:hypothetical protein
LAAFGARGANVPCRQLEVAAAGAAGHEPRSLYDRNSESPGRVPRIAPATPRPIAGTPRRRRSSPPAVSPADPDGSCSPTSRRIRSRFASSAARS